MMWNDDVSDKESEAFVAGSLGFSSGTRADERTVQTPQIDGSL